MKMLHSLSILSSLLAMAALADEPVDLATYWETTPTAAQTLPEGLYGLSANYTLPVSLTMKQGSTFDFSANGKTFGITGDLTLANPYQNKTTLLKGGAWNVSGSVMTDYSGTSLDGYQFIVDGATFSLSRMFFVPTHGVGSILMALTNAATMVVTSSSYSEFCRLRESDLPFVLDISTGSKLQMTGDFDFAHTGGGDADVWQHATVRVRGTGSSMESSGGSLTIGQYSPGYTVDVSDGASVKFTRLYLGKGAHAHDNTLIIRGEGTTFTATYPEIGEQSTGALFYGEATNNWVKVLDGATATLSTDYQQDMPVAPYSSGNGIFVSNATLKASAVYLGKHRRAGKTSEAGSNNVLHVTGPAGKLQFSLCWELNQGIPYRPFGAGPHCAIRIEDGAQVNWTADSKGVEIDGTNCLLSVCGTNTVANKAAFVYMQDLCLTGKGNRVEVYDGGILRCYRALMDYDGKVGTDNTIVVSNGNFVSCQYYGIFLQGASNKVIFRGNHPRMESSCSANLYLYNGAKVDFELPLGETAYERPVLSFNYTYVSDGTRGDVEGTGVDPVISFPNLQEYRESINKPATLSLAQSYFDTRMKKVIADTNAALPQGCSLTLSGNQLNLSVKPYRGMLMILR